MVTSTLHAGSGGSGFDREIKLDPEPASVRKAREFVRDSLHDLGFPGSAYDGMLIASELVTNTLEAASETPCLVVVKVAAGYPVIEVHDSSPERPEVREPDFVSQRGRGLHVISALCKTWECVPSGCGKAIVVTLPR
jgi:hypothetical protein